MRRGGVDFDGEGLVGGLEGAAREARVALLEQLLADGVPLDELRRAVAEDRLVLLPVERELEGRGERLTAAEVAERAALEPELFERIGRSLGLALAEPGERVYGELDVEAARAVKRFMDAGFDERSILEVNRAMGQALSQLARTVAEATTRLLLREGGTERDMALRLAAAQRELFPVLGSVMEYVLRRHQLELARQEAVTAAEIAEGRLAGARRTAVAFADLVGFTRLGEELPPEEVGTLAERLNDLALEAATPPVRLVKMIGDAAMLASHDPDALLEAALALVERGEEEGGDFPQLRAGVAYGEALARAGDLYGRPVNLASRVTAIARPGSVLATAEVRESVRGEYAWSAAGRRRIKGVRGAVSLHRVRRASPRG